MPAIDSTHFTSMRDQVVNLLKELQEILDKFTTLLIAFIAATNTDTGKSLFMKHDKLMMLLVLTIVLYSFLAITGTIVQIHDETNLVPIITCSMLMVGSAASVLALSFISTTIALITLALWVGMFSFIAYDYAIAQKIMNWIKIMICTRTKSNST